MNINFFFSNTIISWILIDICFNVRETVITNMCGKRKRYLNVLNVCYTNDRKWCQNDEIISSKIGLNKIYKLTIICITLILLIFLFLFFQFLIDHLLLNNLMDELLYHFL